MTKELVGATVGEHPPMMPSVAAGEGQAMVMVVTNINGRRGIESDADTGFELIVEATNLGC
jgi:hypothetical protein